MSGLNLHSVAPNKEKILSLWEERCLKEMKSARTTGRCALRDLLPLYLDRLDEALAAGHKIQARPFDDIGQMVIPIGEMHGADGACNINYTLGDVIDEYHILRDVLFHLLEKNGPLTKVSRDIVLDSIDQAVKNAVVAFTQTKADVLEKFVHTLTHDLRTPICVARMNVQLALKNPDLPQPVTDCIKRTIVSLNRLDSMIQDQFDVSRLRAGECLTLQYHTCDLDLVMRDVIEDMTKVHGARFVLYSNGPIEGSWARDGLRRAVEKLIDNAVKHGVTGTPIGVSLKRIEGAVELTVHYEGSFIPANEIPFIFDKHRPSLCAQEGTSQGCGVELTLVKAIADSHQGQIRVESAEGTGTRFTLEIPMAS